MFDRRATLLAITAHALAGCADGRGVLGRARMPAPTPAAWQAWPAMPHGLAKFGAAAVGTQVFVIGGHDTRRSVLQLDTVSGTWREAPPLARGTDNVAVLARGDQVHAIGGEAGLAHQVFDTRTGRWSAGPPPPRLRFASAAAVLNGRLHLIGGWNGDNRATGSVASHDIFDPATGTWAAAAPLATARNAAAAAVLGGRIAVVGGRAPGIRAGDQASLASVEVYDAEADRWHPGPPLPQARASLAAVTCAGRLYALGGETAPGAVCASVTRLDALSASWTVLPDMPQAIHGLAAVVVGGAIVVMGGFTGPSDATGTESRRCWRLAPGA